MVIRTSPDELKWFSIWQLSPYMPGYYRQLFKYSTSLFRGLGKEELVQELETKITFIATEMGRPIQYVYWVYDNLPALNSFTKSMNPKYEDGYIYKHTIKRWFDEIEDWVFNKIVELEPEIRFTTL